ncbi:phage regulatory CII family protein [Marinobacterium sedimentorum]|uniref:phage regulatory CII family protein n=1 Tax=Marinobacterium sedimentorum TaxID=2927804 RepID=UPI0020C6E17B|nr:phage regulatory CII family protein [Marinobacterium sedimentorum]MCP8687729.1 phage regulatory CII family protein [Marinobacterium sedimentorum]
MSRRTRQSHGGIHTPQAALYHAVHDYIDGLVGIAKQLNKNPETLRKKLDPAQASHKLLLEEALQILSITRDSRILDAFGAIGGAVWFRPDEVPQFPADLDVLKSSTTLMERAVAVISELEQSLADGDISADERARLDSRLMRLSQSAHHISETARKFETDKELS